MINLIADTVRVLIGAGAGIMAIAFLWVSIRSWQHGRPAFEANSRRAYPSLLRSIRGEMRPASSHMRDRTRMGVALTVGDEKFVPQERFSSEALDEVIGRRV